MLYLYSDEYDHLKGPFECVIKHNIRIQAKQVLIVEIEPSLNGYDFGILPSEVKYLLLRSKYRDAEILKLENFPIDVLVFLPENLERPNQISKSWRNMRLVGWAKLNVDNKGVVD